MFEKAGARALNGVPTAIGPEYVAGVFVLLASLVSIAMHFTFRFGPFAVVLAEVTVLKIRGYDASCR